MLGPSEPRRWNRTAVALLVAGLVAEIPPAPLVAQEDLPADSAAVDSAQADETSKFLEGFRLYGGLRLQAAVYEAAVELQDNASRIGFRLTRDFFDSGIQVFGQVELGLTLLQNFSDFNVSGSQGGLGRLIPGAKEDAVFARLGFLGLDFGRYGIVTVGKQWSTYYDVSGYSDNFYVFGGQASGTFPLSSDGGGSGTGRSDKTLSYRFRTGGMTLGAQAQLEANRLTGLGSFGGSAQYRFPIGLTLGVAGNYTDIPQEITDRIIGAEENGSALVFGAKYESPRTFVGATFAIQESQDARLVDSVTVAFDGIGFEAFGYHELSRRIRISGGFNYLDPDAQPPAHPDFRILFGVLGGAYYLNSQTLIYAEWRISDSIDQYGDREPNVFALGLRLDFGLPEMQRNDAPPLRFPESNEPEEPED
ncbi:MAG: porin [Gemmatimonadota bacterium]|jgi:predicted porin